MSFKGLWSHPTLPPLNTLAQPLPPAPPLHSIMAYKQLPVGGQGGTVVRKAAIYQCTSHASGFPPGPWDVDRLTEIL